MSLRPEDLRIETFTGDGKWVRVTHLPSGEVATAEATDIGMLAAREHAVSVIAERLADDGVR